MKGENGEGFSFKLSWGALRQLLFALPVLHVTFCCIHLFFYQFAFGWGIAEFYSASDVLTVSYRDVGPAYLCLVLTAAVVLIISSASREDKLKGAGKGDYLDKVFAIFIALVAAISLLSTAFYAYFFYSIAGRISIAPFAIGLWSVFALLTSIALFKNPGSLKPIFVFAGVLPFASSAAMGAMSGDFDRIAPYDDFTERPHCQGVVILRSVGDYFLAVRSDDRRVLIDSNCETNFELGLGPMGELERQFEAQIP